MPGLLRSLWREPRPPSPSARTWRDWALVAVVVLAVALEAALRSDLPWRAVSTIVAVGLAPTLLWRRSRPLVAVAVVVAASGLAPLLTQGHPVDIYTMVYVLILPYSLARWGSGRETVLGAAIIFGKICIWLLLGFDTLGDGIGEFAFMFASFAFGAALRYRAGARARELDQVKLLERERLARDLHDTVAHHVSAMAVRAQAGIAVSEAEPGAALDALRVIESEASRALAEMRAMVRLPRGDEPAETAPSPRISDLERLAGRSQAGPPVDVEIVGDVDDLHPSVGAAIYRLAQESVTNARRHARHATRIEVRVAADERTVRLRVTDDGDTGHPRPFAPPGFGLIGMIERAGLLGGTCEAGPNPDRGWTVTAVLPRTRSATA